MLPVAIIHVPITSPDGKRNLQVGLDRHVWGWKESVWTKPKARASIVTLAEGEPILLVLGGPNPRSKSFASGMTPFQRVVACSVRQPVYYDTSEVWSDDVYPHRIGLTVLGESFGVELDDFGEEFWEACRKSGCAQGAPYVVDSEWDLETYAKYVARMVGGTEGEETSMTAEKVLKEIASFDEHSPFDQLTTATRRIEAEVLRRRLVGEASTYTCDLCGREVPTRLIVAAHIKRRSECSNAERGDPNVVMGNCLLGCDILYELGVVTVGPDGIIGQGTGSSFPGYDYSPSSSLGQATVALKGKKCRAFAPATKAYFDWHFKKFGASFGA